MKALAVLGRYRFASGAEEKIIRTFSAPGNFVENFRRISNVSAEKDSDGTVIIESMFGILSLYLIFYLNSDLHYSFIERSIGPLIGSIEQSCVY